MAIRKPKDPNADGERTCPRAKRKLPKTQVQIEPEPEESDVLKKMVETALKTVQEKASDAIRRNYSGEVTVIQPADDPNKRELSVTITHLPCKTRITESIEVSKVLLNNTFTPSFRLAAQNVGHALGSALAHEIVKHYNDCHVQKSVKPQDYKYLPDGDFIKISDEVGALKKVGTNVKKKVKVCKICGETPDLYPEWVGECEHSKENFVEQT